MFDVNDVRVTIETLRELVNYEYAKVELLVPDIQDYAAALDDEDADFDCLLESIERDVRRIRKASENGQILRAALHTVEDYNL